MVNEGLSWTPPDPRMISCSWAPSFCLLVHSVPHFVHYSSTQFQHSSSLSSSLSLFFSTSSKHWRLSTLAFVCPSRQFQPTDSHAHTLTPLCLYLIIGSITDHIFSQTMPLKPMSQAGRIRGAHLSIPHHMNATELALPLTEMNEFNISPFWSTDDLQIWRSISLSQEALIFCSDCEIWKYIGRHLKEFRREIIYRGLTRVVTLST